MKLLVALLLLAVPVQAQNKIEARAVELTATTTSQAYTLSLPLKSLSACNRGSETAYLNVSGSGVAATTGEPNIPVLAGECMTLVGSTGEQVSRIGVITEAGTTPVLIRGTR